MKKVENKTGIPVTVLIEDLLSDEQPKKIFALQNLNVIVSALGPERTKSEFIPYMHEILDDQDQVLLQLTESLPTIFELVGPVQNLVLLLPIYESLCKLDEVVIREKAQQGLKKIIQIIDVKKNEDCFQQLFKRLFENDFALTKNVLAFLIPLVYPSVSQVFQQEIQQYYTKMVSDDNPQVRKGASNNFREFVKLFPAIPEPFVVQVINAFLKDDQIYVRQGLTETILGMNKVNIAKNQGLQQQIFKSLSEDSSWRVKYSFIDKIVELATLYGKDYFRKNIFQFYLKAFSDEEPEMKSISALRAEGLVDYLEAEDISKILVEFKTLSSDSNSFVRNSLAVSLLVFCEKIGKKQTTDVILPIFLTLLKDQDSEVRVTLFKKLGFISKIIGIETLSQSTVPALTEISSDKNWRIRAQSVEVLSFFAQQIGQQFFNDKIIKIIYDQITDKVFGVRESAVQQIKVLTDILGNKWAETQILPKIISLQTNQVYLQRLSVLFALRQLSASLTPEFQQKQVIPTLQNMARDSVANVRLNVAKTVRQVFSTAATKNEKDHLKKILMTLSDDKDIDVKRIAKEGIELIQ